MALSIRETLDSFATLFTSTRSVCLKLKIKKTGKINNQNHTQTHIEVMEQQKHTLFECDNNKWWRCRILASKRVRASNHQPTKWIISLCSVPAPGCVECVENKEINRRCNRFLVLSNAYQIHYMAENFIITLVACTFFPFFLSHLNKKFIAFSSLYYQSVNGKKPGIYQMNFGQT